MSEDGQISRTAMAFFRSVEKAAPSYNPELPWPLHGLTYGIMFVGPLGGAGMVGLFGGTLGIGVGLGVGLIVALGNTVLFDRYVASAIAKLQPIAVHPIPRLLINIIGFAWAIALSALSMVATFALLNRLGLAPLL